MAGVTRQPYSRAMGPPSTVSPRFERRVALVTGGASGIGRATAVRLAAEGATVVAADLDAEGLATLPDEVAGEPGSIRVQVTDVSSPESVAELVASTVDVPGRLDVVVNVAGVLSFSHTHEHTLEEWNRLLAVNLTGTFLVCRAAIPHLLTSRGTIVNLASTAAHRGQPWSAAYVASKGGVLALTKALAVEYARAGLRVNSVSPGAIDTPIAEAFHVPEGADHKLLGRMMPLDGFGSPQGIAAAIAYLASDEAAHVNGTDVIIDGAMTA
jgi:NAD(P)-dependent dehydrogenase (short-subunit alcohol dehydrogenase family)